MDVGKFKTIDFDDDDALPAWLRGDEPTAAPQHDSRARRKNTSQVKSTEGFSQSRVKQRPQKPVSGREKDTEKAPTVSIQIHMPQFRLPKVSVPWRALRPWIIVLCVVLALLLGGKWMQEKLANNKPAPQNTPVVPAAELGYKPVVPPARTGTSQTTAIPKPSFDEKRRLYTFNDIYNGANITVNQQAIPEKLKSSEAEVKRLATSIGATDSFTTTLGKVYIMTSKESGTQRLMLANDKMLMFIQSTKILPNSDWVTYIQSLQ